MWHKLLYLAYWVTTETAAPIHAPKPNFAEGYLLDTEATQAPPGCGDSSCWYCFQFVRARVPELDSTMYIYRGSFHSPFLGPINLHNFTTDFSKPDVVKPGATSRSRSGKGSSSTDSHLAIMRITIFISVIHIAPVAKMQTGRQG